MRGSVLTLRRELRPLCPDFEPDCLALSFCEAWRCAVDLRRGLTGDLAHCPMCGTGAVATYPSLSARPRRQVVDCSPSRRVERVYVFGQVFGRAEPGAHTICLPPPRQAG